MDFPRTIFHVCAYLGLLAFVPIALAGQDIDLSKPVDVPDEIGLGERLALVAWLQEHGEPASDTNDLTAIRAVYLRLAHPAPLAPPPDNGPDVSTAFDQHRRLPTEAWVPAGSNSVLRAIYQH